MKIISFLFKFTFILILALVVLGGGLLWYITSMPPKSVLENNIERFTGYKTTIAGAPELALWPALRLYMPDVTVNAHQGDEPLLTAQELFVQLAPWQQLWSGLAIEEVRLIQPHVYLETYANGQANWQPEGQTVPATEADHGAGGGGDFVFIPVKQAVVEDLRVIHRQPQETMRLEDVNLKLGGADPAALKLDVRGRWNRKSFEVDGTFDVTYLDAIGVDMSARLPAMTATAQGRIIEKSAWQGRLEVRAPSLRKMVTQYAGEAQAAALPFDERLEMMLDGRISGNSLDLSKLDVRLGNALTAVGTFAAKPFAPSMNADLTLDTLDLNKLGFCGSKAVAASTGNNPSSGQASRRGGAPWTDDLLPTGPLASLNGQIKITVPRLTCADAPVTAINLESTMDRGRVNLSPLEVFLKEDGRITITGDTLFGQGVQGSLNAAIEDVAVEIFLPAQAAQRTHVPLNGNIELSFNGSTTRELARSLAGQTTLTAQNGVIPGNRLFQLLLATGPLSGFKSDVKEIRLDNLDVNYKISDGIATAENVRLIGVGEKLNLQATGNIDLPAWQIDHMIQPAVEGAGLLNVPVKVTGALDSPSFQPQIVNENTVRSLLNRVLSGSNNTTEESTDGQTRPQPEKVIKDVLQNLF